MNELTLIVCFSFAAGGLAGFIWCLVMISRCIDSEGWPRVDCDILESQVQFSGKGRYWPKIKYKYSVNGLPYEGNAVRFGGPPTWKPTAEKICRKYSTGATARVSIDPEMPERSVLIPGISFELIVALIVMIGFMLLGTKGIVVQVLR
jgi:hypothetical protein